LLGSGSEHIENKEIVNHITFTHVGLPSTLNIQLLIFKVDGDVTARRIYFRVMDKDTFTADDLIGKASIKLSEGQANGVLLSLALVVKEEVDSDEDDD